MRRGHRRWPAASSPENPQMKLGYSISRCVLRCRRRPAAARSASLRAGVRERRRRRDASTGGKAMLLSEIGRPAEAVKVLRAVPRERGPRDAERARHRARPTRDRPAEALADLRARRSSSTPREPMRYQNIGIALLKLDRRAEARDNLEMALALRKAPRPRLERARRRLDAARRRPRKAIDAWEECLEINPEQYDALYNIGRVAGQMQRLEEGPRRARAIRRDGAAETVRQGHRARSARCSPT